MVLADGKVVIETGLDDSGIKSDLSRIGKLATTGLTATTTAITAATGALSAFVGYSTKMGSSFEAGMSEVEAISGATSEQMAALTEKAKEMGAATKFSASESAEALKYMAMAGWKTEDMLNGLEGIMNLAAASGEDLASVSDIVTDALTAFGLQASDSGHFADVLARAASSSNTNVGLMGATFQYVAPLAGALGYSIEDTAVAIGLMANAGIKGEKAGTALRSILTRLSDPPKDAAEAMDALGISMTNADGTMRPLSKVMSDLRLKFADLSEEQKVQMASSLGGQEAMSGLLAIVNASDEDFEKLTESINNANGAAEEMAQIMNDNLKGDIVLLQSALEGLGIDIYENVDKELRNAVQSGIGYVNELADAMRSGGLKGAVKEAGSIFANIATEAANQAPRMIRSGVQFIKSFVKGVSNNKDELWDAAVEIAETFANGLTQLLPRSVRKPVQEAVETMSKSLSSGGLKKSISVTLNLFESLATSAGKVLGPSLKTAANAVDFLAKHTDILIPILLSGVTAFGAYKVIGTITKLMTAYRAVLKVVTAAESANALQVLTASGALTAKEIVVGLITGKITLATAATTAWNTALTALGGPIGLAITALGLLTVGVASYKATQEDAITKTEEWASETEELIETLNASNESIQDNIERRKESLENTEAEAGGIDKLTSSLLQLSEKEEKSTEDKAVMATIVDELNQKIPTLGLVIDEETGYLNLNRDALLECIQANSDYLKVKAAQEQLGSISEDLYVAEMNLKQAEQERSDAVAVLEENQAAYSEALEKAREEAGEYGVVTGQTKANLEKLNQEVRTAKEAVDGYDEVIAECNTTIKDLNADFEYTQGYIAEYSKSLDEAKTSIDEMGASTELLAAVHSESSEQIHQELNNLSDGFLNATNSNREQLEQQVVNLENNAQMMTAALQSDMPGVTQEMVDQLNQLVFNAKAELDKLGPELTTEINEAGEGINTTFGNYAEPFKVTSKEVAESGKDGFDSADVPGYLSKMSKKAGEESADALFSTSSLNENAGKSVGESANKGLDSSGIEEHFKKTGNSSSQKYTKAILSHEQEAYDAGNELGQNSYDGLDKGSEGSESLGSDFASGYANGIWGGISAAVSAAASMASQAIAAVKREQASASPSKKTRKLAHDFDDGYIEGILDKTDEAANAAEVLTEAALESINLDGIDVSAMVEQMKQTIEAENYNIGAKMSSGIVNKVYESVEMRSDRELIDYEMLASYIVTAFIQSGVKVDIDKRTFGRIVGEVIGT